MLSAAPAVAGDPSGIASDDFNRCGTPGGVWTRVSPVGDGSTFTGGAGTTDARLALVVPAGTSHDPWGATNKSVRVMQPSANVDFGVEVKFDSTVSQRYQIQGVIVEQDADDWLRFDVYHDGTSARAFAASTAGGTSTTKVNKVLAGGTPAWMRVSRQANTWTHSYSYDGVTWTINGTFSRTLTVASVGPFGANHGSTGAIPAHTALVDYFANTAHPIAGEDQGVPTGTGDIVVSVVGNGTVTSNPATSPYACGTTVGLTATPASGSAFQGWSGDLGGTANPAQVAIDGGQKSVTATFASGGGPTGIASDDFNNRNLITPRWTFEDPLGGATVAVSGAGTGDARVSLAVPAGVSHDPYGTNRSVRVMQAASDVDFELEVKFDSPVSRRYQIQGILVEQDGNDWIRFDLHHDGSNMKAYAATTVNGTTTTRLNNVIAASGAPLYMRVSRQGSTWTQRWSTDGATWTTNGSFSHALTVARVGPFAANAGSAPPAHTAAVDWFSSTASPILAEDGVAGADTLPPLVHAVRTSPGSTSVRVDWATDETATGVVEYGLTTAYELGSVSQPGTAQAHTVELTGLSPQATYHLRAVSEDPDGRRTVSSDMQVATSSAATLPVIDVWYGDTQTFGSPGRAQSFVNVLGNVSDPDGIASLTYSLNGSPQVTLSRGPDNRRLALPGDFNADIPYASLVSGANTVVLRAADSLGNTATRTVTVNNATGQTWPLPYSVDWATVTNLQGQAQIVDGLWQLQPSGPHPLVRDYDRLLAIGDISWTNYEAVVPIAVHSVDTAGGYPAPSYGPVVGLGVRWQGHTAVDTKQPAWGYWPAGGYVWYRWRTDGTQRYELSVEGKPKKTSSLQLQVGQTYLFKFRVTQQATGRGLYQFRVWRQGDPEPATWLLQIEGKQDLASGSVLLIAHHVDATFGNLTVTRL